MSSHAAAARAPAEADVPGAVARPPGALPRAPFDPGPPVHCRAHFLSFAAKNLVHGIREACTATWRQPFRWASYVKAWRRRRTSGRAFSDAQLALGRRMYAAGIDDGESGVRVQFLDSEGRGTEAAEPSSKALDAERVKLLIRLATSALAEEAPLPGADAEYRRARDARAALRKHDAELAAAKALLIPRDEVGWCRVAVGCAALGFLLFLAAFFVWVRP